MGIYNEIFSLEVSENGSSKRVVKKKKNSIRMDEFWMITNGETSIFHQLDMNS